LSKKERLEAELEQAIKDEDYEKAAQLRDEIEGLK
jgi:protein-arginine kinase activator protein McsA